MNIETIMSKDVACCRNDDPLSVPCRIMWERDCGFVPVVDEYGRIVGVVTDRDISMAAYTQGRPLGEIATEVAMARLVYYCRTSDSVASAEALMKERQVRRLPVVDVNERVVGVVSLSDLARRCQRTSEPMSAGLTMPPSEVSEHEIAATLSSICAARPRQTPRA